MHAVSRLPDSLFGLRCVNNKHHTVETARCPDVAPVPTRPAFAGCREARPPTAVDGTLGSTPPRDWGFPFVAAQNRQILHRTLASVLVADRPGTPLGEPRPSISGHQETVGLSGFQRHFGAFRGFSWVI